MHVNTVLWKLVLSVLICTATAATVRPVPTEQPDTDVQWDGIDFPQQGFVDHVATPTLGLAWTMAEDALDRYLIKPLEGRTRNPWARILLRSSLNPASSFAAVMSGKVPWYRDNRVLVSSLTTPEVFPLRTLPRLRRAQRTTSGRWAPYAQLLAGGLKVTHEELYPAKKVVADASNRRTTRLSPICSTIPTLGRRNRMASPSRRLRESITA